MNALPASFQRWLTLLLPPVALLVCCFVMMPRQNKLQQVNKDIKTAKGQVEKYLKQLKAIADLPPDPMIATLPMTKQEQSDFLRGLSSLCSRTGNRIMSIQSLAAIPQAPSVNPQAAGQSQGQGTNNGQPGAPGTEIPADVIAIKSTIMFEGDFNGLRAFLGGLERSRRLISMSECRIGNGHPGFPVLHTTLTITRYVDAPQGSAAPAQPAQKSS
jgi:hypothetical protein